MFYKKSNIKEVPAELIEIDKFHKPYVLNGITYTGFVRYAPGMSTCYYPMYRATSICGNYDIIVTHYDNREAEVTIFEKSGRYSKARQTLVKLNMERKPSSFGLFMKRNAYLTIEGSPIVVGDKVDSRNGEGTVMFVTHDAIVIEDHKNKTILVRRNDAGALDAMGIVFNDESGPKSPSDDLC